MQTPTEKKFQMATRVIRSLKDPIVVDFLRLSTEKKLRYAWKKCIVTSPTLIGELSKKFVFEDLLFDKKPKGSIPYPHKNLHVFTPKILERVGQLKNAGGGIMATLPIPTPLTIEAFEAKRMLILDGIDDLGELGTLLRSAAAFDWDAVWITHSCGDPFDPACIRSSQGALFELPYRVGSIENALKHCRRTKTSVKVKFEQGRPGHVKIGLREADLTESQVQTSTGDVCLLIRKSPESGPATTDFKRVQLAGLTDGASLPLSVSASTLMYAIRDRYFSHPS